MVFLYGKRGDLLREKDRSQFGRITWITSSLWQGQRPKALSLLTVKVFQRVASKAGCKHLYSDRYTWPEQVAGSSQLQQCSPANPLTDLPGKPAGHLPPTCPLIQCPPEHPLQSHSLSLSNQQLQHPAVPGSSSGPTASCIFLSSHFTESQNF